MSSKDITFEQALKTLLTTFHRKGWDVSHADSFTYDAGFGNWDLPHAIGRPIVEFFQSIHQENPIFIASDNPRSYSKWDQSYTLHVSKRALLSLSPEQLEQLAGIISSARSEGVAGPSPAEIGGILVDARDAILVQQLEDTVNRLQQASKKDSSLLETYIRAADQLEALKTTDDQDIPLFRSVQIETDFASAVLDNPDLSLTYKTLMTQRDGHAL